MLSQAIKDELSRIEPDVLKCAILTTQVDIFKGILVAEFKVLAGLTSADVHTKDVEDSREFFGTIVYSPDERQNLKGVLLQLFRESAPLLAMIAPHPVPQYASTSAQEMAPDSRERIATDLIERVFAPSVKLVSTGIDSEIKSNKTSCVLQ